MATYVISDIHGHYDEFMKLIEKIGLKDEDTLYVLGDILDRGPHPIKTLFKLMEMPNAICMVGNHELMALDCFKFLTKEITDESLNELDEETIDNYLCWQSNGCEPTLAEFRALNPQKRQDVIDFIREFLIYEELTVAGKKFLLVHAGLGNYSPEKDIEDYSLKELIWDRADYGIEYYPDVYVVTGHTPTQYIEENPNPGRIFKSNNHIAIDCGCGIPGGKLAAICLDTLEEYYV